MLKIQLPVQYESHEKCQTFITQKYIDKFDTQITKALFLFFLLDFSADICI